MAKKVMQELKILAPAGQASPAPPLGPTLAPYGISTQEFCNQFNERTKENMGVLTPAILRIYEDRSFDFDIKTPPTSELIRRELKIKKGSGTPNTKKVGTLTMEQVRRIIEIKSADLNTTDEEEAIKIIEGTAKQMGVDIQR